MRNRGFTALIAVFAILVLIAPADASVIPERRKPQFLKEQGHYFIPLVFSLGGYGTSATFIAAWLNTFDTYTDVYGYAMAGDLDLVGLGALDIHLVPETLILDLSGTYLFEGSSPGYNGRGMNTGKYDYANMEIGDAQAAGARLTSTFFDRRFELFGIHYRYGSKLEAVRDPDDNLIIDVQDPERHRGSFSLVGLKLDLTDDYNDPRHGLRIDVRRGESPPGSSIAPDYYVMSYNTTAYVPIGRRSTWVFNYYRADAHVTRQGEISRSVIEARYGLNCAASSDPAACDKVVDNIIAANTYGTVDSLGGMDRLRSYPNGRYLGAHSMFYGTEIRWNLTEEPVPFDFYIVKDVRTVLQAALFYEAGSIADRRDELGDVMRYSTGLGFRIVTASGIVFRADFARGGEGWGATLLVNYPWDPSF